MKNPIVLFLYTMLLVGCSGAEGTTSRGQSTSSDVVQNKQQEVSMIDRETAIRVARERAMNAYESLEGFNIIACEQDDFWHIFLEPANPPSKIQGAEFMVSKRDGQAVSQRELPLVTAGNVSGNKSPLRSTSISRENALAIAKKDALKTYGSLELYDAMVCELSWVWRVTYSPKGGLDGGGPEYVIDKVTGEITDKKYNQ